MSYPGSRYLVLLCILLGIAAAGGCGKKGPLYLPDDAGAAKKTDAPAPASLPASK